MENPKILMELRICTQISNTPLFKQGKLETNEKRTEQYINGINRLLEFKNLWKIYNLDIYITDNTTKTLNEKIKEILPKNIKIVCSINNNYGCRNKGSGDIEQWNYCKNLISKYDYFIHFEPRLYLEKFDFINNFLEKPRNLFVYGSGNNHFFTGLFAIKSSLLLNYISNFNHKKDYDKLGSIEFHIFNYIKNNSQYDTLEKANVIWHDKVANRFINL